MQVLVATDAAGEGVNLQNANLMVNYDLPWNPNRLEQRFGRIHRIGQTEVCHLWNLVAKKPAKGEVFTGCSRSSRSRARRSTGASSTSWARCSRDAALKDLLIEAIRYGDQPALRARRPRDWTTRSTPSTCAPSSTAMPWRRRR